MADEITSAITSAIAGAGLNTGSGEESGGESATDSTSDSGSESPDSATADDGTTVGDEGEAGSDRADSTDSADSEDGGQAGEQAAGQAGDQKPKGKEKRRIIPMEDHERALKNAREEAARQTAELQKKLEALKWAEDPEAQARVQALDLAERNPEKFAEVILQDGNLSKAFRKALDLTKSEARDLVEGRETGRQPVAKEPPKPNAHFKNEDGSITEYYDTKGLQDLVTWAQEAAADRAVREAQEAFRAQYEERFGPVEQAYKAATTFNEAVVRNRQLLDQYRATLEGYKELEPEIQKLYLSDEGRQQKLSVLDCYYRVREADFKKKLDESTKKAAVEREKVRKELLDEMNAKSEAVGERVAASPQSESAGSDSTEAAIRGALRKKGLLTA